MAGGVSKTSGLLNTGSMHATSLNEQISIGSGMCIWTSSHRLTLRTVSCRKPLSNARYCRTEAMRDLVTIASAAGAFSCQEDFLGGGTASLAAH